MKIHYAFFSKKYILLAPCVHTLLLLFWSSTVYLPVLLKHSITVHTPSRYLRADTHLATRIPVFSLFFCFQSRAMKERDPFIYKLKKKFKHLAAAIVKFHDAEEKH